MPLVSQPAKLIQSHMDRIWPHMEREKVLGSKLQLHKDQAASAVEALDAMISPHAKLTDGQASVISGYVIDYMAGRPDYPSFLERIAIATYINSCR